MNFKEFLNISKSLNLPEIKVESKIRRIDYNKNPILILLKNGTKLFLTLKQFKNIEGKKPEINDNIIVTFQGSVYNKNLKINTIKCYKN